MRLAPDVPLAPRTTLGVGGPARLLAVAESEEDVALAFATAAERGLPVRVLGGGSNLVVSDAGVAALVLAVELRGIRVERSAEGGRRKPEDEESDRVIVRARAGEPWDPLVERVVAAGLSGLECLSGIPGKVGATPIQNVGAYGQEVKDTLVGLRAYDRSAQAFVELDPADCELSYRNSRFKTREPERFVVTEVAFGLRRGPPALPRYAELARALEARGGAPTLADVRSTVLELRRAKSMLLEPGDENARSCGSFFLNPVVDAELAERVAARFPVPMPRYPDGAGRVKLSAAWLIERAGFVKGSRFGAVGISSRHALALVCHEGATAAELRALAERVQAEVLARTDVALVPEPVFW